MLIIDAIEDDDDSAEKFLIKLCPSDQDRFMVVKGKQTRIENIRKTFEVLKSEIQPQDSFLLYINGHGSKAGNGYIQVENGYVSNQMLEDFLFELKTPDNLLIIDSCYAGNFLRSLRNTNCAMVVATDRSSLAWATCMQPLWDAWSSPKSDTNGDGAIDILEAYTKSTEDMAAKADENRKKWLKRRMPWERRQTIVRDGFMSPQYGVFGLANDKRFKVYYAP